MDSHHKTKRGKFRDLSMKEFQEKAHLPIWGKERSILEYKLPFKVDRLGRIGRASRKLAKEPTAIPDEELGRVGSVLTAASPQSHIGPFATAIDFLIPDGTKVLAAHNGRIVELQEHSDSWGDGPEYRDLLNYITIEHNGEFSQYAHLGQNSARALGVSVGQAVEVGQPIATVGKTGWTDRDHLHFIVFKLVPKTRDNPFGFIGVHPRWA